MKYRYYIVDIALNTVIGANSAKGVKDYVRGDNILVIDNEKLSWDTEDIEGKIEELDE